MEFLATKDQSEGLLSGRTTWEEDIEVKNALKKRATALLLDYENNRQMMHQKVTFKYFRITKGNSTNFLDFSLIKDNLDSQSNCSKTNRC